MHPLTKNHPRQPSTVAGRWSQLLEPLRLVLPCKHITNAADDIYLNSRTFLWPGELEIVLNLSAKRLAVIRENLEIALKYVFTQPFLSPSPTPLSSLLHFLSLDPSYLVLCVYLTAGGSSKLFAFPRTIYMLNFIQLFSVHLFNARCLLLCHAFVERILLKQNIQRMIMWKGGVLQKIKDIKHSPRCRLWKY